MPEDVQRQSRLVVSASEEANNLVPLGPVGGEGPADAEPVVFIPVVEAEPSSIIPVVSKWGNVL